MTCIVLNYLRSLLIICLCVCPKTWQAPLLNPSASLFCDSISYCVSVQRRDRCTVFSSSILAVFSQCVCPKTWQVTALSLHCSTKVQFFHFRGSALSLLICFLTTFHFYLHSVSVQRRGRCSVSPLTQFRSLTFLLVWLHCVSVQRRDRCIITYSLTQVLSLSPLIGCSPPPLPLFLSLLPLV